MPTYEYRCPEGHDFEKFVKMSEAQSELPCPTCGLVALRRVSAGAGLLFKGSGFYITDYGKDGKKDQRAAAAKSEGARAGEAAATGTKGDSAPAASETSRGSKSEGSKSEGSKRENQKTGAGPASKPAESKAPSTSPKSGPAT